VHPAKHRNEPQQRAAREQENWRRHPEPARQYTADEHRQAQGSDEFETEQNIPPSTGHLTLPW